VIRSTHFRSCFTALAKSGWRNDHAAQLVEFAVALPLLVLFVVGIFDFSFAFTLKQKLTNVARDAARAAAADPATDLQFPSTTVPVSVTDAFQDIDNYLVANKISDCGISGTSASNTPPSLIWTYSASTNCPTGGLTITINRGYYFPPTSTTLPSVNCAPQNGAGTAVIATCVSIKYAYAWRFGRVASLLGATSTLPNAITVTAVSMNEN
jgi:Flp pilus assembly protein TadG